MPKVVDKPYNGGKWSKARFHSFITSALRNTSSRWPPKYETRKNAWVERGVYLCAGYNRQPHKIGAKEVQVDHKKPVVDPLEGFTTWDNFITRLFTEAENFQVLCLDCHKKKSKDEKGLRSGKV